MTLTADQWRVIRELQRRHAEWRARFRRERRRVAGWPETVLVDVRTRADVLAASEEEPMYLEGFLRGYCYALDEVGGHDAFAGLRRGTEKEIAR